MQQNHIREKSAITDNQLSALKKTFFIRSDVFAKFWQGTNGKKGFSFVCENEFKAGCKKGKTPNPCKGCPKRICTALTDDVLRYHLNGLSSNGKKCILGTYPISLENMCKFVAVDLDDHGADGSKDPHNDTLKIAQHLEVEGFPFYVLRSRSGAGYHLYVFFKEPVPAWKARKVMMAFLTESGIIDEDSDMSSFDRIFPVQDRISEDGLGNLIAVPFQ